MPAPFRSESLALLLLLDEIFTRASAALLSYESVRCVRMFVHMLMHTLTRSEAHAGRC